MDAGQKYTEEVVKEIEKRLNAEYAAAEKEIQEKLDDYFRRYEIKDKKWQEWVEDGKKTEEQYKAWKTQQLAVGDKWQAQRDMIARDLHNTNEIAKSITRSYMPQVYAENFNYATYDIEHGAKINTSFTLYSKESVERLVRDDPKMLPDPSKRTLKRIADNKDVVWNKRQLQSVMMQGILQGDSIPNLATRLAKTVGERDRKAAVRNARTMATSTQNAGRVDAYKRAEDMGVDVEQMWLATMDDRTRHSHRYLDGETRPVGEAFSNGCFYPADPSCGDPAEVYNCRCSLRGVVKGLDRRSGQFRDDSAVGHMSYEEWLEAEPKYNPILLPEEKGEAIKQSYINEYRGRGGKGKGTTPTNNTPPNNDLINRYGKKIVIDLGTSENIKDEARRERSLQRKQRAENLIKELNSQYDSYLISVKLTKDKNHTNGVDAAGNMELGTLKETTVIHEFAHSLTSSLRVKAGLANDKEKAFLNDISKLYREYNKEKEKNPRISISLYANTHKEEFMAEGFALAKAKEMGINSIGVEYGDDYTYPNKILELVDEYFKKKRH